MSTVPAGGLLPARHDQVVPCASSDQNPEWWDYDAPPDRQKKAAEICADRCPIATQARCSATSAKPLGQARDPYPDVLGVRAGRLYLPKGNLRREVAPGSPHPHHRLREQADAEFTAMHTAHAARPAAP